MQTWQWQTWNSLPYLTCSLLDSWKHGFFTQQFAPRSPYELTEVLDTNAKAFRLQQIHGKIVLAPSEIENPDDRENFSSGDGLVSEESQQALWACSADCTPALVGDVRTGKVSAIHAGWRGTSLKIIPTAIARLQAQGSKLENLRVALGPAIAGEVYQVSHNVALEVGASIVPFHEATPDEAKLESLMQIERSPILPDETPGRVRLDVRRVNQLQLEQLGLAPEHISIAPHCTFQDPTNFFSYRREKLKKIQWSGIVSR